MLYLAMNWALSSLALLLAAYVIPGFRIASFDSAMTAVAAVGLVIAVIGLLLREVRGPVGTTLSSLFLLIVTAFVFRVSALLVPGFIMLGFVPAFAGAVMIVALQLALRNVHLRPAALDSEESWVIR